MHYNGVERNGPDSPKAHVASPPRAPVQAVRELDNRQSRTASTATKELDDLMASLSDFKVNVSGTPTPSQARLSGDYAKPNKPKSPSTGKPFTKYKSFSRGMIIIITWFAGACNTPGKLLSLKKLLETDFFLEKSLNLQN